MFIASLTIHAYKLPLRRPWVAAHGVLYERRGFLLAIKTNDSSCGWGDCAPLPSSTAAHHVNIQHALNRLIRILPGLSHEAALQQCADISLPELRWALETALFDLAALKSGQRLADYLGASENDGSVAVNAALGALDGQTATQAAQALANGYRIAKIKLGRHPVDTELFWLRQVHAATEGRLRLRLDANRAWNMQDARYFLHAIAGLSIYSVEEPLIQPDLFSLRELQEDLPYALALDESVANFDRHELLAQPPVRRLVLKPARIGGILATRELTLQAQVAGFEVVLTSVVDTAVGVSAAAHLAAALSSELAHGFATLGWLAADVAQAPVIQQGRLYLGNSPGLGLEVFYE